MTMVLAVASFDNKFALAENEPLAAEFSMSDGALIRQPDPETNSEKDENGIRFSTTITKAFYDAIELTDGQTIKFYTLVKKDASSVTEIEFGANGLYQAEWKINGESWAATFDDNGKYVRHTDLMNFPDDMYSTVFAARSCYVISDNDDNTEDTIVYADGENSIRTMEGVAIKYLTELPDEFAHLNKYVGLGENGEIAVNEKVGFYGKNKGELQIDNSGLTGDVRVYNGSRLVSGATFTNGKLVLPESEVNSAANVITLTDGIKLYQQTVKFVDFAIGTTEEFVDWAATVMQDRYGKLAPLYSVLTANIDLTGVAFADSASNYTGNTYIESKTRTVYDRTNVGNGKASTSGVGYGYGVLKGELDGQGYTVDGLLHTQSGLFGSVGGSGFTLKNIAFTNIELMRKDTTTARYIFGNASSNFVLENVYFQITNTSAAATCEVSLANDCGMLIPKNCVFDFAFTYAEGAVEYTKVSVFRNRTPKSGMQNVFAISKSYFLNELAGGKTGFGNVLYPIEGYTYSNYGRYDNYSALASAISQGTLDMSEFTASGYWNTTAGYPVWKTANA